MLIFHVSLARYKKLLQNILNQDVVYLPIHAEPNSKIDPQEFAWALRGLPCVGGAISKDIKQSIIPFLDELDPSAREINSVNTIVRYGKKLRGYNTDALGFKIAIERGMHAASNLTVRRAVCYGYGGVTNVASYVLKSLGIEVFITGRRPDMVLQKAGELNINVWTPEIEVDMFVNAAPVTDCPLDEALNFKEALFGCKIAFDHEMPGKYLEDYCNQNNVFLIRGVDMYFPQMVAQWTLFLEPLGIDCTSLEDMLKGI